ncbi:uncharacterized protein LOC127376693 isoform X2 [Dicentrarchus labrax]|uniref:uncharacterized protein LOC127376693 isoform X2 n=1 Tax=Dicentrarchus labrax TaxID=13489 RepID=UPI0021F64D74|nr:uncharacterized protein LOC127376693 isoform X2 [Dicentrarchus labrax]
MDNLAANKSHIPCQSWAGQNGWSTTSMQGSLFNPLASSQHLSLGSSSDQRPSYNHLQAPNLSCMNDMSTLSSAHHSALYKASHINNNSSSTTLFANTAIPSSSHSISFAQQSPHTSSMLLNANQGINIPQTNQAPQPCRPQHLPLLPPHDPYKASVQPPLTNQGLSNGLQDLPISLPSCGQREQHQWIPSSHCREAVNDSDATAHPNKESSQEGNINPLASSERQRSLLLHQRAQLLQQLAELDKHLESIPPDDSSNGRPPHTAVQPQLRPAVGCGDKDETCDAPDDPMSTAESVKKKEKRKKRKNSSAESEVDSDPDYLPNNNDDEHSDYPSDPAGGFSDDSDHSRPSTPTDETPSLPGKKRAKSGSSSCEAESASPPKPTQANKQKKSETVVLPTSNTKIKRVYDRRNYCPFCSKPISKMARHLESIHSDKKEVAAAFQYPKSSRERQKIWNRLINQGNFAHNKNVLKSGKGQLAVRKRPKHTGQAQDFIHCLYCRGLYVKNALYRHMRLCPEKARNGNESKIGRPRIALRCVLETSDDLDVTDGFRSVLAQMTYNDVTRAVMDDKVILQFGELLYNQHGSDVRKHDYIRQNLRQMARLVLEAQKVTPLTKLEDFFLPSNFSHVVAAVNVLAGYNPETKSYSIPSLAIKLGYHLQKTCSIVEGNAVKSGDARLAEAARNFLSVYQKKWNKLISSGALTTLRKTKIKKEKKVPFAEDVKRLNFYMEYIHPLTEEKLRDSPSSENYAALAKVLLARTIIFNRRSAREVSSVHLTAFMSRIKSSVQTGMDISVSDLERRMCGSFTRVDIRGKCGRMVPVLLKPSFVSSLEFLVEVRETCGVPSKNPYLFGRPSSLSSYNGSESLQKYVKACGAKNPEALTSPKIRKHYTTMLQMMNLDENEACQILGPNNQVRRLRQDSSMHLDDTEMGSDERLQTASGQLAASWDYSEHPSARYGANMTVPSTSRKSGKKGAQNQGKHKWDEEEVLAVERHLMSLIEGHKVPQKNDCIQCLEAEPEALRNRSWKGVKDYVRNRITALKRQSTTSHKE